MLGPHDAVGWALTWAGLSGWGASFAAVLALSDEVNGALLAVSVGLLGAFLVWVQRLANLLLRLARAWTNMKVAGFMREQGYDEDTIAQVLTDE